MLKLNLKQENGLYLFGLVVLILGLYVSTLSNAYTWDDQLVITQNEVTVKGLEGLQEIWTSPSYIRERPIYRPIPQTIHALLWEIAPNKPAYAHGVNIFFYILCCLSFYLLIRLYFPNIHPVLSLLIVSFFTLHPIHTEVVANSKSLDELMALFFALLALYHAKKETNYAKLVVVILFSLAVLSKASAITILPFILLIWAKEFVIKFLETLKTWLNYLNFIFVLSLLFSASGILFFLVYSLELWGVYFLFIATILAVNCTNNTLRSILFLILIPALSFIGRWEFVLIAFVIHFIVSIDGKEKLPRRLIAEACYFFIITSLLDLSSAFQSLLIAIALLSYWMKNKKLWIKKFFLIGLLFLVLLFVFASISEHVIKVKIFYLLLVFGLLIYLPSVRKVYKFLLLLLFIPILEITTHGKDYQFKEATPVVDFVNEVRDNNITKSPINPYHNIVVAAKNKSEKYATISRIQLVYLQKLIFPTALVHQHGTWQIELASWKDWDVYLSILIHILLLWLAFYFYKQKYYLTMWGILWYFSTISIYTNIVRLMPDTLAERFLFLPSIGFSVAFVTGIYFFIQKFQKEEKKSLITLALILAPLFSYYAYKTVDRNKDWKDNYTLAANTLPYAENNAAINAQYALELNNLVKAGKIQNVDSAEALVVKHYKKAIDIFPDFYGPNADLAAYYILEAQPDSAFPYLLESTQLKPKEWLHHYYLGLIYFEKNNYQEALSYFDKIIANPILQSRKSEFPELLEAYEFGGRCLHNTGQDNKAYAYLNMGIELYSQKSSYILLANLYRITGKTKLAIETFERLQVLYPDDQEIINTINYLKQGLIY